MVDIPTTLPKFITPQTKVWINDTFVIKQLIGANKEKRFKKENQNFKLLKNKNIPHTVECVQVDEINCIFMMKNKGLDLLEYMLKNDLFNESLAKNVFFQIINILVDLQSKGIKYRDVKLENFVIDSKGVVTIIDIFSMTTRGSPDYESVQGTYDYMAPECHLSRFHGEKSDVWSLGVLFSFLLFGQTSPGEGWFKFFQEIKERNWRMYFDALYRDGYQKLSSFSENLLMSMLRIRYDKRISLKQIQKHMTQHLNDEKERPTKRMRHENIRI